MHVKTIIGGLLLALVITPLGVGYATAPCDAFGEPVVLSPYRLRQQQYLDEAGRWLAPLLPYARIYAALDVDGAGTLNTTRLAALSPRIAPARIPEGNDLTEFAQQGGDVRAWAMEIAGLNPLRVVIPPEEAGLPTWAPTL